MEELKALPPIWKVFDCNGYTPEFLNFLVYYNKNPSNTWVRLALHLNDLRYPRYRGGSTCSWNRNQLAVLHNYHLDRSY